MERVISISDYSVCPYSEPIINYLYHCKRYYPRIFSWYKNKFVPGIYDGKRQILLYYINNNIAGIALLKRDYEERKICMFRVDNIYKSIGVGRRLFNHSMELLETEQPMITIPNEIINDFYGIINYYHLELSQKLYNHYRKHSIEWVFNGTLQAKPPIFKKQNNIFRNRRKYCER